MIKQISVSCGGQTSSDIRCDVPRSETGQRVELNGTGGASGDPEKLSSAAVNVVIPHRARASPVHSIASPTLNHGGKSIRGA